MNISRLTSLVVFPMVLALSGSTADSSPKPQQPPASPQSFSSLASHCVYFPHATLNSQPIMMILDTGSGFSELAPGNAKHLSVTSAYASDAVSAQIRQASFWLGTQVQLNNGNQNFTVQLPVMGPGLSPPDTVWFFDCLIGWPQVQGNDILFFDSTSHQLSALDKLPSDISSWIKLKIHPSSVLAVDVPLPNGETSTLSIDTGSWPVALPAEQYKEWKAAHLNSLVQPLAHSMLGDNGSLTEQAWADSISIGPLTLTGVMVYPASDWEAHFVGGKFAGLLGMDALERMDMIVDNKDGYAYLLAKIPHSPPFDGSGINHGNFLQALVMLRNKTWLVADNVRISYDGILINSALYKALARDFYGAKADLDRAQALNPANRSAYFTIGLFKQLQGDWAGAEAAFTDALTMGRGGLLSIQIKITYLERGIARQNQGNFTGALADYDQAIVMRPEDSNPERLYREILRRRQGLPEDDFTKIVDTWSDSWMKCKGQFLTNRLSEADFLVESAKGDKDKLLVRQCETYYFVGILHLLNGDAKGAQQFFQKCLNTNIKDCNEYFLTKGELERLLTTNTKPAGAQ